jgi:hypothetical protein
VLLPATAFAPSVAAIVTEAGNATASVQRSIVLAGADGALAAYSVTRAADSSTSSALGNGTGSSASSAVAPLEVRRRGGFDLLASRALDFTGLAVRATFAASASELAAATTPLQLAVVAALTPLLPPQHVPALWSVDPMASDSSLAEVTITIRAPYGDSAVNLLTSASVVACALAGGPGADSWAALAVFGGAAARWQGLRQVLHSGATKPIGCGQFLPPPPPAPSVRPAVPPPYLPPPPPPPNVPLDQLWGRKDGSTILLHLPPHTPRRPRLPRQATQAPPARVWRLRGLLQPAKGRNTVEGRAHLHDHQRLTQRAALGRGSQTR